MNIVGISAFGQNPAACILKSGKLIAFAEEERFIHIKSAEGYFPSRSLAYCLSEARLTLSDVDVVAVGWDHMKYRFHIPFFLAKSWLKFHRVSGDNSVVQGISEILSQHPAVISKKITLALRQTGYTQKIPLIRYYSHHLSHAASAFYSSGFPDAAILVMDGSGEEAATSIYTARNRSIEIVKQITIPDSLGWYYAAVGSFLGFKPYEEDGYLMGLASYGKNDTAISRIMRKILFIHGDGYTADPLYTLMGHHTYSDYFSDELVEVLGPPRRHGDPITQRHKNIAYAAQASLEEVALHLVRVAKTHVASDNICLAGGVALNVKMNGRIVRSKLFRNVFIQPVSHDGGTALGAAMLASAQHRQSPAFSMTHAYWGPRYTDGHIQKTLLQCRARYTKETDIARRAAAAIAEGKIVAWFQGRMEAGPRSLGNRSILANPTIKGMNDYINNKVKHREPWRPFCPSFTEREAEKYYSPGRETRFMIIGFAVPDDRRQSIPAVVHVDNSIRPQTVTRADNPLFCRLIQEVGKHTGVEAVLNTSFNNKGEPVVCSPEDALRCFYATGIDNLAIGDYWVEK